jgi:hypothetical protein
MVNYDIHSTCPEYFGYYHCSKMKQWKKESSSKFSDLRGSAQRGVGKVSEIQGKGGP